MDKVKKVVKTGRILNITKDQKLLLAYGEYEGWYQTPGGWCEKGEDSLQAAIREGKEELGINILPSQLVYKFSISTERPAKVTEKGFDTLQKEEDFYLLSEPVLLAAKNMEKHSAGPAAFPRVRATQFIPLREVVHPEFPLFPPLLKERIAHLDLPL